MGNWTITIHGVGAHHNEDYDKDANRMAAEFADKLKAAGHSVEHVSFTSGSREDLLSSTSLTRGKHGMPPAPPAGN